MEKIFAKIRNNGNYTDSVGKYKVKNIRDLTTGYDTNQVTKTLVLNTEHNISSIRKQSFLYLLEPI